MKINVRKFYFLRATLIENAAKTINFKLFNKKINKREHCMTN